MLGKAIMNWFYGNNSFFKVQMPKKDICYNGLSMKNMSVPVDKIDVKGAVESLSLDFDKLFL